MKNILAFLKENRAWFVVGLWGILGIFAAVCDLSKTLNIFAFVCALGCLLISVAMFRIICARAFLWFILAFVYAVVIRGWLLLDELWSDFPPFPMTPQGSGIMAGMYFFWLLGMVGLFRGLARFLKKNGFTVKQLLRGE